MSLLTVTLETFETVCSYTDQSRGSPGAPADPVLIECNQLGQLIEPDTDTLAWRHYMLTHVGQSHAHQHPLVTATAATV